MSESGGVHARTRAHTHNTLTHTHTAMRDRKTLSMLDSRLHVGVAMHLIQRQVDPDVSTVFPTSSLEDLSLRLSQ